MNWYRVIATVLIGSISFNLFGQTSILFSKSSYILPYKLEVTTNKTSNLVFPSAIASIDRGSQDIIVEKAVGVENILRIKAGIKIFEETNLTVITNEGRLYSFIVSYNSIPSYLNVNISNDAPANRNESNQSVEAVVPAVLNAQDLKKYCQKSLVQKSNIHWLYDEESKISLALTGFYVKDNTMFCSLRVENDSRINFDIDQLRIYIRDKNQSKRTATQEIEIFPLYIHQDSSRIKGKTKETLVIAVPKFTIPNGKFLAVEIMERNGSRHLALKVKNRHVVKARGL